MNIIANRYKYFAVSLIVIISGILAMFINAGSGKGALNFDIEFTGGTSFEFDLGKDFNNKDIESLVTEITGQTSPRVQRVVGTNQVSIKIKSVDSETRTKIVNEIKNKYGIDDKGVLNVTDISGTISGEMQKLALIAIFVACAAMLVYISIRFKDYRAGISAIIALLHDVLVMLAFYSVLRIPINNSFIAAVLTVLGYSINATIVIFDRIRENKRKYKKNEMDILIDKSVNQTLARSINTTLTTLFTIGAIYVLGVQSVKEFALPLIIGITSGAYSSIFISGSVWYMLIHGNQKK